MSCICFHDRVIGSRVLNHHTCVFDRLTMDVGIDELCGIQEPVPDAATGMCNIRVPLREESPVNIGVRHRALLAGSAQNRHVQSASAGCLLGL